MKRTPTFPPAAAGAAPARASLPLLLGSLLAGPTAAQQCSWTPTAKLVSTEGYQAASYVFGRAIAADGTHLAIGAPGLQGYPGTAFAFERYGDLWYPLQELGHAQSEPDDRFGAAASLHGHRLLVGAPGTATVHAFEAPAGAWSEVQVLSFPGSSDSELGAALALEGDLAVVGDPGASLARVFVHAGGAWQLAQSISVSDAEELGTAVALSGDRLAIGDPDRGRVHVFRLAGGLFVPEADLVAAPGDEESEFGAALDLEGGRLVVGSPSDDDGVGSVQVFELGPSGWGPVATLSEGASAEEMEFGASVSLEGERLLVGAPLDEAGIGTAWLYELAGGVWSLAETIAPDVGPGEVNFGNAVHLADGEAMANVGIDEVPVLDPLAMGYVGSVHVWQDVAGPCPSLLGFPTYVSASFGGSIELWLEAGAAHAGRPYLLLGSLSGAGYGVPAGPFVLPLNPDFYFFHTLSAPNTPPLQGSFGTLGAGGAATAQFSLPQGAPYSLVGAELHHAYAVLDPALPEVVAFVSTAFGAQVLP